MPDHTTIQFRLDALLREFEEPHPHLVGHPFTQAFNYSAPPPSFTYTPNNAAILHRDQSCGYVTSGGPLAGIQFRHHKNPSSR